MLIKMLLLNKPKGSITYNVFSLSQFDMNTIQFLLMDICDKETSLITGHLNEH